MLQTAKVVEALASAKRILYTDRVRFITVTETINTDTGKKEKKRVETAEYACRLSYQTLVNASNANGAGMVTQNIKLFLDKGVSVPLNSMAIVLRYGNDELRFKASGVPNVYATHQEVALEKLEEYA